MAISDTQKVDFLWKKTIYGVTNTGGTNKQGYEETIGSSSAMFGNSLLSETIPTPAPNATGSVVQYYGTTSAVQMTADPTVSGNYAWIATGTFGTTSTRLTNWIPPAIDAGYLVEIYKNDPTVPANKLLGGVSGQEWVYDYAAGVLRFVNSVPSGITSLYIVGHRYIGKTGVGGAGVNVKDTSVTYEGNTLSSGTYTFNNFFDNEPQAGSITVEINSQRIESDQWSYTGRNLVIDLDTLPYSLDGGDIVSARYAWAV